MSFSSRWSLSPVAETLPSRCIVTIKTGCHSHSTLINIHTLGGMHKIPEITITAWTKKAAKSVLAIMLTSTVAYFTFIRICSKREKYKMEKNPLPWRESNHQREKSKWRLGWTSDARRALTDISWRWESTITSDWTVEEIFFRTV